MSTISDVATLYDSLYNTWDMIRADVISHLVLLLVVFVVCHATLPDVAVHHVNASQITGNGWFKLAKETGLLYLSLIIPVVVIIVYSAALRSMGKLCMIALFLVFSPKPRDGYSRYLDPFTLEPLALSLRKEEFGLNDLLKKAAEVASRYEARKGEYWDDYQESMQNVSKNSLIYLGDFTVFLVTWFALFHFARDTLWVQLNQDRFWSVAFILFCLVAFGFFRASKGVAIVPALNLLYICQMIQDDPEMAAVLDESDEHRRVVRQRLSKLLEEQREEIARRPSLLRYVRHRCGLGEETGKEAKHRVYGWPFPELYRRGARLSYPRPETEEEYNSTWLGDYAAYLYRQFHSRLLTVLDLLWEHIRVMFTGAP